MPVTYAEDVFFSIKVRQDDCRPYGQQPDGYGRKIATTYLVRLNDKGPWRRVYMICFSNAGSYYIIVNKEKYYFRGSDISDRCLSDSRAAAPCV